MNGRLLEPTNIYTGIYDDDILDMSMSKNEQVLHYPRASGLYAVCIRQLVLGTLNNLQKVEMVGFNRQLTFDIGNAVHKWIQNSDSYLGNQRRGIWKCNACGNERIFGKPPRESCRKCGARVEAMEYKELELIMHKPLCVTGHPDLFIEPKNSPGVIRVVELKTMSGQKFSSLKTPLIEHVWQVMTYMWACNKMAYELTVRIDNEYGYIIYVSKKELKGHLPMKVFVVENNKNIMQEIKNKLSVYKHCIENKILPDMDSTCKKLGANGWKARSCPAFKLCTA